MDVLGEGGESAEADVQDHAQAPDVDGPVVAADAVLHQNFWRDVGWSSTEARCEAVFADELAQTEVCELDCEVAVD